MSYEKTRLRRKSGKRRDTTWCRAVCATCGARYLRARWRERWGTGTECGDCFQNDREGRLWKVPDRKMGAIMMALPKERARQIAKWQLHMHNLGLNNE